MSIILRNKFSLYIYIKFYDYCSIKLLLLREQRHFFLLKNNKKIRIYNRKKILKSSKLL